MDNNYSYLFFQFTNSDIKHFHDVSINYKDFKSTANFKDTIQAIIDETTDYLNKGNDLTSEERANFLTSFAQLLLLRNELAPYIVYLSANEVNNLYRNNHNQFIEDNQFYNIQNKSDLNSNINTVFIEKILKLRSINKSKTKYVFIPTYTYGEYDQDILEKYDNFSDYLDAIHLTALKSIDNFNDLVDYSKLCEKPFSSRKKHMNYYSIYNYVNDELIAHLDDDKTINKELYHNKDLFIQFVDQLKTQIKNNLYTRKHINNIGKNRIDDRNYRGYLVFMNYDNNHIHLNGAEVYHLYYKIVLTIYNVIRGKLPQSLYKQDLYCASKGEENMNFSDKMEEANEKMAFRYGSNLKLSFLFKNWKDFSTYIPIKFNDDLSNYAYSVYLHIKKEIKINTHNNDKNNEELTDAMMNTITSKNNATTEEDIILKNKLNKYIRDVIFKNVKQKSTVKNYDKNLFFGFSKGNYSYFDYGAFDVNKKEIIDEIIRSYISGIITSFYEELINDKILENNNSDIIKAQLARLKHIFYLYDECYKDNGQFNFDEFKKYTRDEIKNYKIQNPNINRNFCWYYSAINNPSEKMDLYKFQSEYNDSIITDYYNLLNDYLNEILDHVKATKEPKEEDYKGIFFLDCKTGLSKLVNHQSHYYDENTFNIFIATTMEDIYYEKENSHE